MKLKVCDFCGTEYGSDMEFCPLCGKGQEDVVSVKKEKNKRKKADPIPRWMWGMTCVLLGLAVLVGLVYFLFSMGIIGPKVNHVPKMEIPTEQTVAVQQEEEPEEEEPEVLVCEGLTLSQSELILEEQGGVTLLSVVPIPRNCEEEIRFTSLDETVATVDEDGMITAVAPGETEILVTCGEISEVCIILCDFEEETEEEETTEEEEPVEEEEPTEEEEPVEEEETQQIGLSSEDFTLRIPGEETYLTVRNAPSGATITYASSDPSVATVTEQGKVVAVGNGTATITVTVNGETLTCIARCNLGDTTENNEEEVPANLQLSHADVTLGYNGEKFTLSLSGDGKAVSGAAFSSENTAVCTVDANGVVTAVAKGTTNVNVTYGGKTYTCIVRCNF